MSLTKLRLALNYVCVCFLLLIIVYLSKN